MANFSKIPNDLIRSPLLTVTDKTVCIVLLSYNPSFPSYEKIMKDSNIGSKATISKALRNLVRHKFIEVIPDSKYRSNLYRYIEHDFRKELNLTEFNDDNEMNSQSSPNEPLAVQEVDSNKTNTTILNKQINATETPIAGSQGQETKTNESSTDFSILEDARRSLDCKPNYFRKSEEKHSFFIEGL